MRAITGIARAGYSTHQSLECHALPVFAGMESVEPEMGTGIKTPSIGTATLLTNSTQWNPTHGHAPSLYEPTLVGRYGGV